MGLGKKWLEKLKKHELYLKSNESNDYYFWYISGESYEIILFNMIGTNASFEPLLFIIKSLIILLFSTFKLKLFKVVAPANMNMNMILF